MKHRFWGVLSVLLLSSMSWAQNNAMWLRYPAISPDGSTIVFGYKGDLYRVDAKGGNAVPLTLHEAHDMMPVWSKDGKYIAFASDRYGNFDVFVMPANGGAPVRITSHSSNDYPYDFTPDGKHVILGSARNVQAENIRFYSPRLFQNLYKVPVTGGKPVLVSGAGMEHAHYNTKGTQIVFQDRKGYEDPWRKHHTSSVTRDIWVMDVATNKYRKISGFEGEDREPVFSNNDQFIYYLSEKNGTQNIYRTPVSNKMAEAQLTKFDKHPVRHLSIAKNNTLCFTYDGEIYTLTENGTPQKVAVQIANDGRQNIEKNVSINGNMSEFAVSPSGKEVAFVVRGEVFVASVDGGPTKRITNTPQQERMVSWSPDSKTLLYATERGNSWDVFKATVARKEEPYFYAATLIKEEPVIATPAEEFQAKFSPDGKEIAFIEERNVLRVYNIASKQSRTLLPQGRNYSYSDGDWDYQWSGDSKWIICDDQEGTWQAGNFALIKADGSGTIEHPIRSGFGQNNIKWGMDGKIICWQNSKLGRKGLALQGSTETDIYAGFLDVAAFERFKLSKEEFALLKDKEEQAKKADTSKTKKDTAAKNWMPNIKGFEDRVVRLTINSSSIADYAITPDGSKVYYLSAFERGFDLWVTEPRTRETKILAKLGTGGSGIEMSKDGKAVFVMSRGSLMKIDESGKSTPIGVNGEMVLNTAEERSYIFEHAWRQVVKKFYDPNIHGIDWKGYRTAYAKFLPHINNNFDFQELLSEILGELNGSHTGGRYSPRYDNPDVTATLGLLYDETFAGKGLKVTEIIEGGPFDRSDTKLKAGYTITHIDGALITEEGDWASLLNRKVDKQVLVTFTDGKTTWDETLKPISFGEESALMYKRWVKKMNDLVEKLSDGKLGYVHVQGMNDGSFRTVYDEVLGRHFSKQALIVDTRFNGGGWLHNDLNTFLSGKRYLDFAPQGNRVSASEPFDRWYKPSCVLMSEGNYSDAFIFPYIYKQNGIGKLIGMPVPGTGTAVWWETQIDPTLVFGIPMVATIGKENRPSENLQVEPDIRVELSYEDFLSGKDTQLEAAVKEMLKTVASGK